MTTKTLGDSKTVPQQYKGRFDGVDLGGNATLRRQVQSTVRRRHEDFNDAISQLKDSGFSEAAAVIEAMIDSEKKEVGL